MTNIPGPHALWLPTIFAITVDCYSFVRQPYFVEPYT